MMDEKTFRDRYMELYNEAQALIDKYDPCATRKHKEAGICLEDIVYHGGKPKPNRCCSGCPHHDAKVGCKTKALSCKVWFCGVVFNSEEPGMDEFREKMDMLQRRACQGFYYTCIRRSLDETWEEYKHYTEKCEGSKNERSQAA
jgi:hypothetical protein